MRICNSNQKHKNRKAKQSEIDKAQRNQKRKGKTLGKKGKRPRILKLGGGLLLNTEDDIVEATNADGGITLADGFESVLNLEKVTIRGEHSDSSVVSRHYLLLLSISALVSRGICGGVFGFRFWEESEDGALFSDYIKPKGDFSLALATRKGFDFQPGRNKRKGTQSRKQMGADPLDIDMDMGWFN